MTVVPTDTTKTISTITVACVYEKNANTASYTYDEIYAHRLMSYTDGATTQSMSNDSYGNVESSTFSSTT